MWTDKVVPWTEAFTRLISVLIWPVLIAYVLKRFGGSIGNFLDNLGAITLRGGGFEATASRQQAAAALAAASLAWPTEDKAPHATANAARQAIQTVGDLSQAAIRRIAGALILWVDDEPDNDINERLALESFGVRFVLATTTEDGLKRAATTRFDVVISDMARGADQRAGYTLLAGLRASGNAVPFIIYASSRLPAHVAEAKAAGALGCTNRATELFELVLTAIDQAA
jgi:CheY-like chemotaxis protein